MKVSTILQNAGAAALVLFPVYGNLIDSQSDLRMHTPAPLTRFVLAIVVNLVLTSAVFVLVSAWFQSAPRLARLRILLSGFVLAFLADMFYFTWRGLASVDLWIAVLSVVTVLAAALRWRWKLGEQWLQQLSGAILLGLGFFCLFVVAQLLYLATWRPLPHSTRNVSSSAADCPNRPRVVWILFDELSYQQVFGDRYPGLELPNFDKLRESATVFTDVQPVINETEKAIPSILLGQHVDRVDYTSRDRLYVGIERGGLQRFDAARTPFAVAHYHGLTTGVVGWYNPYCGMLAPYVDQCYWTDEMLAPSVFAGESFWQNFLDPWESLGTIFNPRKKEQRLIGYRASVYRKLMRHADRTLQPSGPDFVYLHLPVPHPPGFYDRKTRQIDDSGTHSYIDNLALADETLGHVLAILQNSPRWEDTSVVVCGDHSWRVYTWSRFRDWTAEDQAASHGSVFDPRPLLMVHMAGQTSSATVNTPFPLLGVHSILDSLVEGQRPSFAADAHLVSSH